ncbi:MAG: DNA primase [candidate division WOR-3 bacterium]|nr:DNA primase [candidate division WOR-3 bacterium]
MIKKEIIDRIRNETDIVELIGSYLPLKKAGKYYRALCPFHTEKAPSFYVSPERQIYHCFGCGVGGSVITFVMNYEKLSFPEAIKSLASRLGITLEFDKISSSNQPLYDTCEFAANFFTRQMNKSETAMNYLKRRGLKPETIQKFRLGFAPGGNLLYGEARKHRIPEDLLLNTGLISKKESGCYDWFFDRLIFPILSLSGKIIAFGGRVLDPKKEPKYLNSPETAIFRKGGNFYGLFQAKNFLRENTPIVVEGNFDLLSLVDKGILNVVAPLGTALTPEQALILRRYANCAIIAFDGDSSGRAATGRAIEVLLKANIEPQILMLPEGYDPDKYVLKFGKDGFLLAISKLYDYINYINVTMPNQTVSEKRAMLNQIMQLTALLDDEITQELYLNKISQLYNLDKTVLRSRLQKKELKPTRPSVKINPREERLLAIIAQNPEYAKLAKRELPTLAINDIGLRSITEIIYDNVEHSTEFGLVQLIESLPSDDLKTRLAGWAFYDETLPKKEEFVLRLKELKAAWLYRELLKAKAANETAEFEKLTDDYYQTKRQITALRCQGK